MHTFAPLKVQDVRKATSILLRPAADDAVSGAHGLRAPGGAAQDRLPAQDREEARDPHGRGARRPRQLWINLEALEGSSEGLGICFLFSSARRVEI